MSHGNENAHQLARKLASSSLKASNVDTMTLVSQKKQKKNPPGHP